MTKNNRWYLIISMPIKDEHGNVVQMLESSTDITARKGIGNCPRPGHAGT
jgi:hypothetical protein